MARLSTFVNSGIFDISNLDTANTIIGTEILSIVQDGSNKKTTLEEISDLNGFKVRAWGSFDCVTPTTRGSENLSFSRTNTGEITCTFDTAMPDTNYSIAVGTSTGSGGFVATVVWFKTVNDFKIVTNRIDTTPAASSRVNCDDVNVIVVR